MTLLNFKNRLKIGFIVTFLALYGFGSYLFGKYAQPKDIFKIKDKSEEERQDKSFEQPQPYSDIQSGKVISSFVKLCSNTVYGFEVSYPKDWFTTYNSDTRQCTYFAPYSFVMPQVVENDFVPIKIEVVASEDWSATVKLFENPNDFQNVLSTKNIEISNRSVEKVEATSTGGGIIPRGFVKISYLVFNATNPLIITYQQLDGKENPEEYKKILDDMVLSLRYF